MHLDPVFYHEDNFCQIELVPIQNLLAERHETNYIKQYSEQNFTNDGFINIFSRTQIQYSLANLSINHNVFKSILKNDYLYYFEEVYTGYASLEILKPNVHGLGFENYILYYEFQADIIVKMWLDYNLLSDTLKVYPEKLKLAFYKLGITYNLILLDWNELIAVDLKNETALVNYVREVL